MMGKCLSNSVPRDYGESLTPENKTDKNSKLTQPESDDDDIAKSKTTKPIISTISMSSTTSCSSRIFYTDEYCQAFSNKAIIRSAVQQMMYQQTMLFYGYLRENILIHLHDHNPIPTDIINLCLKFFQVNIESIHTEINNDYTNQNNETNERFVEIRNAFALALIFEENDEYWLSFGIISVLLTICKPAMAELYHRMAIIYQKWNLPKQALEQLLMAHDTDPWEAQYIFECAHNYQILKDFNKAKENYLKAIRFKPNNATYRRCYAELLCAELHELDLAKIYFQKAIKLEPNVCDHYHYYAQHLRDYFKDYKQSEKQYLKCLGIDHRNYGTNGSYGYLLYLMGEYDKAKKHIEIELSIDGINECAHYYLGLIYYVLGNEKKANQSLYEAVKVCSQSTAAVINIDHLKTVKAADPDNIKYHNKFEELMKQKCKLDA